MQLIVLMSILLGASSVFMTVNGTKNYGLKFPDILRMILSDVKFQTLDRQEQFKILEFMYTLIYDRIEEQHKALQPTAWPKILPLTNIPHFK